MPKIVDNYVFERRIGSGQYGDVFKGYNRLNQMDVAIKAIKRQSIKGKFTELLENEIKVLKSCDNRNIIKLYDIKKTPNNFYLILQYCNEGDLLQYLKRKKFLSEEEAIEMLIQILNAFKTLVKNKIMHRDFKLANILMHDGEIKIADFGFAKLLNNQQYTETMLGSPLNMAPEVLGGNIYNTKADIWSIGACFFELLFGTPPYKAGNMVDLVNNIKNKPLKIPKQTNNISDVTEDVIRKMLVVDPKKRIEWQQLFKHPINNFLQDNIRTDMQQMKQSSDELSMSKFYLKNNMVVDHPKQIMMKQNINNYAFEVINNKAKQQAQPFKGQLIQREKKQRVKQSTKSMQEALFQTRADENEKDTTIPDQQTEKQKQIKAFKQNSNRLLHYRNIYVLLASVGEETINQSAKYSDIAGYMLIRKLVACIQWLKDALSNKKSFQKMKYWELYVKTKEYEDIRNYIVKQYSVFNVFLSNVHNKIKNIIHDLDVQTEAVYNDHNSPLMEKVYQKILRQYVRNLYASVKDKKFIFEADQKKIYIHISRILDCLSIQDVFQYQKDGVPFNFRNYYNEPQRVSIQILKKEVNKKMSIM